MRARRGHAANSRGNGRTDGGERQEDEEGMPQKMQCLYKDVVARCGAAAARSALSLANISISLLLVAVVCVVC